MGDLGSISCAAKNIICGTELVATRFFKGVWAPNEIFGVSISI